MNQSVRSTMTPGLVGLLDTPGGRPGVRPAFDRQVVDRLLKFDRQAVDRLLKFDRQAVDRLLELDDQRADLFRREADILGDELAFEV